jgi:GAF domain-containing protein
VARSSTPGEPEEPLRRSERRVAHGGLAAAFLQTVGEEMGAGPLSAGALSRAVARLLPVDGVGISSLVDELRLPLGASTAAAERAEELQSTLGDGPCLAAAQTRTTCAADLADLLRRWPLYGEELTRRTPYRSAASIPLRVPDGQVFAALDLYAEEPHIAAQMDLDEVDREIGASLGALLDLAMHPVRTGDDEALPEWYEDATARRQDVWVAIGMIMGRQHQPSGDALSVLRGYAYSHDRSLDDVAEDMVQGRLKVHDLEG